VDTEVKQYLAEIREQTDLPLAVGFGISTRSDIDALKSIADYAIIGSAAMRTLQAEGVAGLDQFWASVS
jgi:tryptophan synthase alpha chain